MQSDDSSGHEQDGPSVSFVNSDPRLLVSETVCRAVRLGHRFWPNGHVRDAGHGLSMH